jgi:hypothetical protein
MYHRQSLFPVLEKLRCIADEVYLPWKKKNDFSALRASLILEKLRCIAIEASLFLKNCDAYSRSFPYP